MSRASQLLLVVFVFGLALWSCTSLLGDFSTKPGDQADTGASPATMNPGTDGEAPDAPAADAVMSDDSGGGTCSPQAARCSGNNVQTCDMNGAWGASTPCPSAKPFCNGTGVCGVCADSTTQCAPSGGVQTCVAGAWLAAVPCMNQACSMGACSGTCPANGAQCSGNGVQKCDSTAHWGSPTPCVNQACVSGACQGVCMPGDTTCFTGGAQTCDSTGAWRAPTACGAHQSCTGGASAGPAICTCASDPTCTASGLACASATSLVVCAQDAQGCWYASSTSTCANGACFGSAGSAQCCTNACTSGATQCGGAGLQTCQAQGNRCTAWNAGAACGSHQGCTGSAGSASCSCTTDPLCSVAGTVCANSTTTATCAQDAQNCFYQASTSPCGANKNCQGGSCVCTSGYTACGSNCVNINNDNNNCGGCNKACPLLSSPSSGSTCGVAMAGQCLGYVGGYVSASGGPLLTNPDTSTVVAVKAQMPAVSGTFVGIGAVVGSNETSGTTQMIYGLYSDSGGAPGTLLFNTSYNDTSLSFANPSSLFTMKTSGGLYSNGFNNALAANATYWIYMKGGGSGGATGGVSSSPCVAANWINVDPPASFATGTKTCAGNFNLYMIVSFP